MPSMTQGIVATSLQEPTQVVEDIEAGCRPQSLQETASHLAELPEGLNYEENVGHLAELPEGLNNEENVDLEQEVSKKSLKTGNATEDQDGLTKRETILLLVVIMIGSGVLAFPYVTAKCGYVATPILCVVVALAYAEVANVIHASMMVDEAIKSFEALGSYAIGCTGVVLVRITRTSMFFGYMVTYTILLTQNLGEAIPLDIPDKVWMAIVLPLLMLLAMLKDFKALAKLMPIGFTCAAGGCILICIFSLLDAHVWQAWTPEEQSRVHRLAPQSVSKLGQGVAVMFAAFAVMGKVPEIHGKMANRTEFPSAIRISLAITCFVYLAVMGCGHYAYGVFAEPNTIVNIMYSPMNANEAFSDAGYKYWHGPSSEVQGNIVAGMVSVNLLLSFPSSLFIVVSVFESADAEGVHAVRVPGSCANRLLRAVIVLAVVGIAAVVPYFTAVLALFASVFASANNVFLPMLFAFQIKDADGQRQVYNLVGTARRALHVGILLLAIFCTVFGLRGAIESLVEKLG